MVINTKEQENIFWKLVLYGGIIDGHVYFCVTN